MKLLIILARLITNLRLKRNKIHQDHKDIELQCTKIIGKRFSKYIKNLNKFSAILKKSLKKQEIHTVRMRFLTWTKLIRKGHEYKEEGFQKELVERNNLIENLKKQNKSLNDDLHRV